MDAEIRASIKEQFNYTIPFAEVKKAGINTINAVIENELEPLETEYTIYRKENNLWSNTFWKNIYKIMADQKIYRIPIVEGNMEGDPEVFYEQEK